MILAGRARAGSEGIAETAGIAGCPPIPTDPAATAVGRALDAVAGRRDQAVVTDDVR